MKWKALTTLALASVLLSGCAKLIGDTYCDLSKPHLFADQHVVDWLMKNDRQLLTDTIVHNETYSRQCGEK